MSFTLFAMGKHTQIVARRLRDTRSNYRKKNCIQNDVTLTPTLLEPEPLNEFNLHSLYMLL